MSISNSIIYEILCISWVILPVCWFLYQASVFQKINIWIKDREVDKKVLPYILFFLLPFGIVFAIENIQKLINNNDNSGKIELSLRLVTAILPVSVLGNYVLKVIDEKRELQTIKDSLSIELINNYVGVCTVDLLIKISNVEDDYFVAAKIE